MRYGIFGDIHGNLEALQTVLAQLAREGVDRYLCVGDLVGYGADPVACIEKVREIGCPIVAGNHDFAAAGLLDTYFFNLAARHAIAWTSKQLSKQDKVFLKDLRLLQKIPTNEHKFSLTLVHATPYQPEMFEYIQTRYDLESGFQHHEASLCFVGHSHVPMGFVLGHVRATGVGIISLITVTTFKIEPEHKIIINVGSVGQPRDEDPRACYTVYDDATAEIRIERIEYDVEKSAEKIIRAGLPASLAERIQYGR